MVNSRVPNSVWRRHVFVSSKNIKVGEIFRVVSWFAFQYYDSVAGNNKQERVGTGINPWRDELLWGGCSFQHATNCKQHGPTHESQLVTINTSRQPKVSPYFLHYTKQSQGMAMITCSSWVDGRFCFYHIFPGWPRCSWSFCLACRARGRQGYCPGGTLCEHMWQVEAHCVNTSDRLKHTVWTHVTGWSTLCEHIWQVEAHCVNTCDRLKHTVWTHVTGWGRHSTSALSDLCISQYDAGWQLALPRFFDVCRLPTTLNNNMAKALLPRRPRNKWRTRQLQAWRHPPGMPDVLVWGIHDLVIRRECWTSPTRHQQEFSTGPNLPPGVNFTYARGKFNDAEVAILRFFCSASE